MINADEIDKEATALRDRFASIKGRMSRAEFARQFKVPGGDSMIYQNIKALKPISREAALAYAKGFGCSLDDISPRLAKEARTSSSMLTDNSSATVYTIHESSPRRSYVSDVDDLVRDFESLSEQGKAAARDMIKVLVDFEAAKRP